MALKPVIRSVYDTFIRPLNTTAYASGDLIADSTTAASVTPLSWTLEVGYGRGLKITGIRIKTSSTTATNATFRVHLWTSSPTVTNGDNGAILPTIAGYLGYMDCDACAAFSDAIVSFTPLTEGEMIKTYMSSGTVLYGLVEARAAYTPDSGEEFRVDLTVEHY